MRRRVRSTLIAAIACATLMTIGSSPLLAQQKTYEFRIQTAVPNSSLFFQLLERFVDNVDRMSNGRLQGTVLPAGAEVSAFDILDAVSDGVVQAGYAWPHYWSGKHSAFVLFSNVPASTGMDQATLMSWFYSGDGQKLYKQLTQDIMGYNTVHFLVQPVGPDPLGWFSERFENLDDFRQLKYRAPPGIAGRTYNEMGIPAVAMPGGDIVPSAQRGVIDAAEWANPADDRQLGLNTIWDYYYLQGLHQQTDVGELIFNKDFFDGLPDDLRAIIEIAARSQVDETRTTFMHENAKALRQYREEGIKVLDTPQEYYPKFIKAQNKVIKEYISDNEFFAEVYRSQAEFAELVYPYHSSNMELWLNVIEEAHQARRSE